MNHVSKNENETDNHGGFEVLKPQIQDFNLLNL